MKKVLLLVCCICLFSIQVSQAAKPSSKSDLIFSHFAQNWDEGIPLGNGVVGALIWQKNAKLRFALDRTDLWDLRPMHYFDDPTYNFEWVKQHIRDKNYKPVQDHFDAPYEANAAPAKIPGAALEFPLSLLGSPTEVRLLLGDAVCKVTWKNGASLRTFVSATRPIGWFVFKKVPTSFVPEIIMPVYEKTKADKRQGPSGGQDVAQLGYPQGSLKKTGNMIVYHQPGYNGFSYEVAVTWKRTTDGICGVWSISTTLSKDQAKRDVLNAMKRGMDFDYKEHLNFWDKYWGASSVRVPDDLLQKEYDNDMYKFGASARSYGYPVPLQAVWTADNGHLPPWKGDYHHDLNTQLSYWPAFEGNHLSESMGFVNTLWNQQDVYKKYTKQYFGKGGLNVPGVCSLTGEPLGGWIQYAMSQSTGAWLSQYFYWQWKFSADDNFLRTRAYPFIKEVATFLEQQTSIGPDGKRTLEFSSSPEMNRNSLQAWFPKFTNYDLSLTKFAFRASSEMAKHLGLDEDSRHWKLMESQLPDYYMTGDSALTVAKDYPDFTHRHFSNAMAIFPLELIDWSDGPQAQKIIRSTLDKSWEVGTKGWWGFTFVWMAHLEARARNGEAACKALRTFAQNFVSPNTFCLNGDQSGKGISDYTDRAFTLEGNFAFASGIQQMLMQSQRGVIKIFPAIPATWKNVSFKNLRAEGAFLVSAVLKQGKVVSANIFSEKGGQTKVISPSSGKVITLNMKPGEIREIK